MEELYLSLKFIMDDSSFNSEEYEEEMRIIDEMFPNCLFSICIDLDEMDEVISNEPQIIIQHNPCRGYCDMSGNREYIYVKNNGNGITNKDIIKAMIEAEFDPKCNHIFLEGFDQINAITFSPMFGS